MGHESQGFRFGHRRSVLKWLAALPFVGAMVPQSASADWWTAVGPYHSFAAERDLPQLYELKNGKYIYRGHIIRYEDSKTWPPYRPPSPGYELEQKNHHLLIWTVRQYFPNATLTFDERGAVVSDGSWSFVACSREAIEKVGSGAGVFFVENLYVAASLKIAKGT